MNNLAFFIGFSSLITHEIDAIANHEWRVLPIIRGLPDVIGMNTFIIAHVPIFAVLVALVSSPNNRTRMVSRLVISTFLLVHCLLHLLFMNHHNYEFESNISNILIFGGGIFGGLHLALEAKEKYSSST